MIAKVEKQTDRDTTPVRQKMLPYGRQWLDEEDVSAVVAVLRSDWLTTGPKVAEFERAFAGFVKVREAIAVSSGTAALHAAMYGLAIGPGDEVVVPAMTFAASANCVVYQGATPVFTDVDSATLLIDPHQVEAKINRRTKAIIAVDYAGQPCDYDALQGIANHYKLSIVADACHALGGSYEGRPVGSLATLNTFSLHPVKHITTGEGGMITTNDTDLEKRMRSFRNHGITSGHNKRETQNSWVYEMTELGYNYRLTDFQSALGLSQLRKLPEWVVRRQQIARCYDEAFADIPAVEPLEVRPNVSHAYHLYVIRLDLKHQRTDRALVYEKLRAEGIGVNVHYIPVHLHPFYRARFGTGLGMCPVAEAAYERIISLPIFPRMTNNDVTDVITAVRKVLNN